MTILEAEFWYAVVQALIPVLRQLLIMTVIAWAVRFVLMKVFAGVDRRLSTDEFIRFAFLVLVLYQGYVYQLSEWVLCLLIAVVEGGAVVVQIIKIRYGNEKNNTRDHSPTSRDGHDGGVL